MSAINEWFGYYNATFEYIRDKYGDRELAGYLDELADRANSDRSAEYRAGGLDAIEKRYAGNFRKDGDPGSVACSREDGALVMRVKCPAFYHAVPVTDPKKHVGPFFCGCCEHLERRILENAGFELRVERSAPGDCVWTVSPRSAGE